MADKAKAQEWKTKGNAAFQAGNFQESVEHFSQAIKCDPSDHVLYSNRSGSYASLKNYQQALNDADQCVKINPNWAKGWSRKGLAESFLGKLDEAESSYRRGLEVEAGNQACRDGLRSVMEMKKESRGQVLDKGKLMAVLASPKYAPYMSDEGFQNALNAVLESGDLSKARHQPKVVEAIFAAMSGQDLDLSTPDTPPTQQGGCCPAGAPCGSSKPAGHPSASAEEKKAPPPDNRTEEEKRADEAKERGNGHYKKKEFAEALAAYEEAIAINPNEILYSNNKAAVYLEQGDFDKCIATCEAAIEKGREIRADYTKIAKLFCRMAACYTKMKNYDKAIWAYDKALTEDNQRTTRALLADVKKMKDKAEAEAFINPEIAEEHRQKGNDLFKAGDYPAAKKEYDQAIARNPKDAKLYTNRALAFSKLFEHPSALKDAEKAIELVPTFVKAYARKGNAHLNMKEYNKAMEAFQKGLNIDSENQECRDGLQNTMAKISESNRSGQSDPEQLRHAMADPEIQSILRDPQFNLVLKQMQEDPRSANEAMKDPKIASAVNKLVAAGVLKIG